MVFWWQVAAARGSHQWSWVVEEEVLGFGWEFWRERERESEKCVFSRCWSYLQPGRLAQAKFCSLGQVGPTQTCLGEFWVNPCSNIFHYFCAKVISPVPDVISQIATVKMWRHGLWAYSPNLKATQRLTNLRLWFFQSEHKCQSGKEFFGKETCRIHSHPDVVRRPATIFYRQPNVSGDPREDFTVSFPSMVQPQPNLRLSWGCPGTLDRTVYDL